MADLNEIIEHLPLQARHELLDFAEFLERKYTIKDFWPEQEDWKSMAETSLKRVWDNFEDDIYDKLL